MRKQFLPQGLPGDSVLQVSQRQASRTQGLVMLQGMISSSVAVLAYQLKCRLQVCAVLTGSLRCFILVERQPWEPGLTLLVEAWQQQIWTSRPQTLVLGGMGTTRSRLLVCWCSMIGAERSTGGIRITCGFLFWSWVICSCRLASLLQMGVRSQQSTQGRIRRRRRKREDRLGMGQDICEVRLQISTWICQFVVIKNYISLVIDD